MKARFRTALVPLAFAALTAPAAALEGLACGPTPVPPVAAASVDCATITAALSPEERHFRAYLEQRDDPWVTPDPGSTLPGCLRSRSAPRLGQGLAREHQVSVPRAANSSAF